MIEWPDVEELKQYLDVTGAEWDGMEDESDESLTRLSRALAAAIAYTKKACGEWDELVDEPDASLADAAMSAAIKFATLKRQVAVTTIRQDPVFQAAIMGHRRRFAIA